MSSPRNGRLFFPKILTPYITAFWGLLAISLYAAPSHTPAKEKVSQEIKERRQRPGFSVYDTVYIDLLNDLGEELRFYKADSLLLLSKMALEFSQKAAYRSGEGDAYYGMATYYSDQGEHEKAIQYFEKAMALARDLKDTKFLIMAMNSLAGDHAYKGNYAKALGIYMEGIELARANDDQLMLSIMHENIAHLYIGQKDYEEALEYYKIVKKINEGLDDPVISAETMSNIASLYADMGESAYAKFNINRSISTFERREIKDWLAYAYEVKGKIYLKESDYKWALYWYRQSELLHKDLEDKRQKIDLFSGMAEAYLGMDKDSLSHEYAKEAYALSKKIQFNEGIQKCAETLYKINKKQQNYGMALEYHEVFQRISDTISQSGIRKGLTMLKAKMEHERQKQDLIEENEKALAKQEGYVNSAVAILIVFIIVTILVHRGERVQKTLNTELQSKTHKLESSQNELQEVIKTKDKLFSIVAHDLRGPIGAFQGLLNLFKDEQMNQEEFLGLIPKLRADIDHIAFTLNNLLSWGRTQLNGVVTKPSAVSLHTLVSENINLLSGLAANKSLEIVNLVDENTMAWSDSDQIDIVIRNLISNALKFTPPHGRVTIQALEKNSYWEVAIQDTGVGIDQETQDRLFRGPANVTTYGTNNEKGTGLGLALCKEMVEKNKGEIWVDSRFDRGSCFYFTIPKYTIGYKNAV